MGKSYNYFDAEKVNTMMPKLLANASPNAKRALKTVMNLIGEELDKDSEICFQEVCDCAEYGEGNIWTSFVVAERVLAGTTFSRNESRTIRGVKTQVVVHNTPEEEYDDMVSLISSFMVNSNSSGGWGADIDRLFPDDVKVIDS